MDELTVCNSIDDLYRHLINEANTNQSKLVRHFGKYYKMTYQNLDDLKLRNNLNDIIPFFIITTQFDQHTKQLSNYALTFLQTFFEDSFNTLLDYLVVYSQCEVNSLSHSWKNGLEQRDESVFAHVYKYYEKFKYQQKVLAQQENQ